jgi:HAMP domain-containing protein
MTQVGGLDVLLAWVLFGLLLLVLAWFVLRRHVDPIDEAARSTSEATGEATGEPPDGG